jgi:hypothetical protein
MKETASLKLAGLLSAFRPEKSMIEFPEKEQAGRLLPLPLRALAHVLAFDRLRSCAVL